MERQQRGGAEHDGSGRIDTLIEGLPCQIFDLIDVIGEQGQVFSGVQRMKLHVVFLQQGRRHVPPDSVIHGPNGTALKELLQAVDPQKQEPRSHHHQNPEAEPAQTTLNDALEYPDHHQTGPGLQGAHRQNRQDRQEIGFPEFS